MNSINPGGLLWFDDDARRPIQQKIAEAAQRYRERIGYEPTLCQLNPAQATALEASVAQTAARSKRAQQTVAPVALPDSLKLVPSELIQPHCYLIGIGEGEQPRAATLPYRDDADAEPKKSARRAAHPDHAAAAASAATPADRLALHPASATRRAASPAKAARRVHVVQPPLLAAAPEVSAAQTARTERKRAKAGASPAARGAKTSTGAKSAASVVHPSLAAKPSTPAKQKRPTSVTRRAPAVMQPTLTASMLPMPEAPAPKTRRSRAARSTTVEASATSATLERMSRRQPRKRSA